MKTWRTMLLASAAALALTAGAGFAQGTQDRGGAAGAAEPHGGGAAAQPHAAQSPAQQAPGVANKPSAGTTDKADRAAQGTNAQPGPGGVMQKGNAEQNRGATPQNAQNKSDERNAQIKKDENRGTAQRQDREQNRGTAEQQNRGTAEQQLERNGRLQGNASGVNVRLNDQQRKEIRATVIEKGGAPRVAHVDFAVTVGTVVPRERIHVVPVPEMLVQIEPEWRGYMYFVYEDEIIVVNPSDMKIVAVLPV
jgi:Protein of unknown function (DUF1236)